MKTFIPKVDPQNRKWFVLDLEGKILGRAAVKVADVLRGKNKPIFKNAKLSIATSPRRLSNRQRPMRFCALLPAHRPICSLY